MCVMYDKIVYKFSYITKKKKNQIIMIFVLKNFILFLKSIYISSSSTHYEDHNIQHEIKKFNDIRYGRIVSNKVKFKGNESTTFFFS